MLLMTVAVGLLLQSPQDMDMKNWVDRGFDPAQPNASTVAGTPELSRQDAWAAAERHALRKGNDYRARAQAEDVPGRRLLHRELFCFNAIEPAGLRDCFFACLSNELVGVGLCVVHKWIDS
jgi:hypothetical protein